MTDIIGMLVLKFKLWFISFTDEKSNYTNSTSIHTIS